MHFLKTKKLLFLLAVIIVLGGIGIYVAGSSPKASPALSQKQNKLYAKVRIVDKSVLDKWYYSRKDDPQYFPYVKEVKAGQILYFPIIFSHYAIDGTPLVSAEEELINPKGIVVSSKSYPNIAEGLDSTGVNLGHIASGVLGDNFTSSTNPEKYPLGIYTVKIKVIDKISGITIDDNATVEKVE